MKYVCQYVDGYGREKYMDGLLEQIPELIVVQDVVKGWTADGIHSSMATFLQALKIAGDEPHIHLEDDVILCRNFKELSDAVIAEHEHDLIQFFSMRKDDLTVGSRYVAGRQFAMNQCTYFPKGLAKAIAGYYDEWRAQGDNATKYTAPFDTLMAAYMAKERMRYWTSIPCLVQHAHEVSAINPRRSSKRQASCFKDSI